MTREEAMTALSNRTELLWGMPKVNKEYYSEALDMAVSALSAKDWKFYYDHGYAQAKRDLSENKREPTDEEVIEYCNKRGYVICTQAFIDDLKREQHRIRFEGYVGVDDMGRYDPYTDSFVKGGE